MLKQLTIRDFVLVDRLELPFDGGFGVLTGETGAGKSILVDALAFVLGERADSGLIRSGAERAEVSAVFDRAAWVAAVGGEGQQPTWVVSATEPAGVDDAAALLDAATLADHYAIAASGSQQLRLPTEDGFEGSEASCR